MNISEVSFEIKNIYIPLLILNYISFKAKFKSHMNIVDEINSAKRKIKISVLMFQELLNLVLFVPGLTTHLKGYKI